MGSLEKDQDLSLLHELILWNLFPMVGCLGQPSCRGKILVMPQLDMLCLLTPMRGVTPFEWPWQRSEWGKYKGGWEGMVRKDGGETVIGM